jgi:hypothetical protein
MRNVDELRQLAEGLPSVPEDKFDLNVWGTGKLNINSRKFDCGFAGCAIGWMPKLVPSTKLRFVDPFHIPHFNVGRTQFWDYDAIAEYFGITKYEAKYLFHPDSYDEEDNNPVAVSDRIRTFLTSKGESPK